MDTLRLLSCEIFRGRVLSLFRLISRISRDVKVRSWNVSKRHEYKIPHREIPEICLIGYPDISNGTTSQSQCQNKITDSVQDQV